MPAGVLKGGRKGEELMIVKSSAVEMTAKTTQQSRIEIKSGSIMTNAQDGSTIARENQFNQILANASRTNNLSMDNLSLGYNRDGAAGDELANVKKSNLSARISAKEHESVNNALAQLRMYLFKMRNDLLDFINGHKNSKYYVIDLSSGGYTSGQNVSVWNRTDYMSYSYTETESLSFTSQGIVKTEDGRELNFDIELSMSREFSQEMEISCDSVEVMMTDPLVISLDSNPIGVSDQKWMFDIDADGKVDQISLLSNGSGFLVFDKNNNGKIDDGSEMFGAKTGNGFKDLSEYDSDKNGWIDEADDIYDKLSVWIKDDAGNDKMLSLKQANVGAIYLGNVKSEYALKSDKDNSYNAQIRRSGIYLSESGQSRTIQQLDMVKALVG